jgi:hypothetical protein
VQPKISYKLYPKVKNFLFFATFESIRGMLGIQVMYVHVMHVYQGTYTLQKYVF